jgi:diguanylate cyclase (GGDEF)-like protein
MADTELPEPGRLLELGRQKLAAAEYDAAEDYLKRALEASADAGLSVDVLRARVMCAFYLGRVEDALRHALRALEMADEMADESRRADAHNDLGMVYGRLGDYEAALAHLLDGLRIQRSLGRPPAASLHNNIGNVYFELRDYGQALEFFRAAHGAFRAQGAARGAAIALGNVGRAHEALGETEESLRAFRESVAAFETCGDGAYLAPALARLAGAQAAAGDVADARATFRRALEAAGVARTPEFIDEVLLAAGRFHLQRAEPAEAVALLERAAALFSPGETTPRVRDAHAVLAEAFEAMGAPGEALRHLKASYRVGAALSDAAVTLRLRNAMLAFDLDRARQQEEISRLRNVELANAYEELRAVHEELASSNRELQRISIEDALTGVFNRRYLDLQLSHEASRAQRRGRPLSVAMCDIDEFKQINDRLSHAVGDEVLRRLGRLLSQVARTEDLVCRYGGEEFLLVLPETELAGAYTLAERVRGAVSAHPWASVHPELSVTLSIGLAELGPGGDPEEMLGRADARLYDAKRLGRDRVCH